MTTAFAARLGVSIEGAFEKRLAGGKAEYHFDAGPIYDFMNGSGAGQANIMFSDTRTLAASSSEDLDLSGSLLDAYGNAISPTAIKAIIIAASATNAAPIMVGGSATNQFSAPFGSASDSVRVVPGGLLAMVAPDLIGYTVMPNSADLLKITNTGSGAPASYTIFLLASGRVGPVTANTALLSAVPKDGTALVGTLGGSRQRYDGIGAGNQIRSYAAGPLSWARAKSRRFRSVWYYSTGADVNSNNMSGMLFASDGEAAWNAWQRVPAILGSDAQLVIVALSSNTLQFTDFDINGTDIGTTATAANFVALYQTICNTLIAGGKAVAVVGFWERDTSAGGVWQSGSQPRSIVPTIHSLMATWCAAQGIPFLDPRPTMVAFNGTDYLPITSLVQTDLTHQNILGGFTIGGLYDAWLAGMGFASTAVDETVAGNLLANPAFGDSGGTGVLVGTWQAGSVVPDGWKLSRIGTGTATIRSDFVTIGGRRFLKISFPSAPTDGSQESWKLEPLSPPAIVANTWYFARMRYQVDAFDKYYGNPNFTLGTGTNSSAAFLPTKGAGSGVTDMTDTAMYPGPSVAYSGVMEGQPVKASSTASTLVIYGPSIRAGGASGGYAVYIAAPEIRATTDPAVLMYNEANSTPPALTSSATLSTPEESPFSTTAVASKPVRWSLSGADAALFTIDKWGVLKMTAVPDYEAPADANADNIYSLNLVMADFNPAGGSVSQAITVTITDVADGVTYNFNGTNGTDIATQHPTLTLSGTAGAITVNTNAAKNDLTVARSSYMAPQQGDTTFQEIRWTGKTSSAGFRFALRLQDKDNGLYVVMGSGVPQLKKMVAGTETSLYNTSGLYTSVTNGYKFRAQILPGEIFNIYMNDVLIGSVDLNTVSGGVPFPSVKTSGLLSNTTTGSTNITADDVNFRVAAAHEAPKLGLRALTSSTLTGTAGADFVSTLSTVQAGSALTVTSDPSGLFYTDASNTLKANAVPAGSYAVTVTETNPNAAVPYAAGRATSFTIVIT